MGKEKKDRSWMLIVALGVVLAVVISGQILDRTELNDQLTRTISLKDTCIAGWEESLDLNDALLADKEFLEVDIEEEYLPLISSCAQLLRDANLQADYLLKKARADNIEILFLTQEDQYFQCIAACSDCPCGLPDYSLLDELDIAWAEEMEAADKYRTENSKDR